MCARAETWGESARAGTLPHGVKVLGVDDIDVAGSRLPASGWWYEVGLCLPAEIDRTDGFRGRVHRVGGETRIHGGAEGFFPSVLSLPQTTKIW